MRKYCVGYVYVSIWHCVGRRFDVEEEHTRNLAARCVYPIAEIRY